MEVYRTAKSGDPKAIEEAIMSFRDTIKFTMRGPFMESLGSSSKEMHIMMELPHIIDNYLHRYLDRVKKERPTRRKRVTRKVDSSENT